MIEFKKYKLRELASVDISSVDKKTKEGEIPVRLCNFTDVYKNWAIRTHMYDSFMKATAKQKDIDKFSIKKGQVAITKDSETRDDIGIPTYIADDFNNVVLGYHCALITPHENFCGAYLNAYLNTKMAKKYFEGYASGSGQRYTLTLDSINEIQIWAPEEKEDQERIVKVLNDIDQKIILNTRINAELEAMAKQLYDYWFVQFDFPDENGKPYKSSGGKMVWNEKLKREIPEGWEVKDLNFFANTPKESITPYNYPEKTFKHYSIPAYDECGTYLQEPGSSIQSDKFIVKEGQILVPKLNPWYNRVLYVNNSDDSICSTEFVIFDVYEEYTKGYLYFVVKSESFINYCTKSSTGTSHSQRRVNPDILKGFCVPYNKKIVKLYSSKVMPCILKMYKNTDLNKSTIKLRDSLLPMLMNGQVTIE